MTDIRGLGYLRIQTTDIARWRELVVDGLGMAIGAGPEADGLYLRVDERRARLIVLPGEVDKALAVGWEVRDGGRTVVFRLRDDVRFHSGRPFGPEDVVANIRWQASEEGAPGQLRSTAAAVTDARVAGGQTLDNLEIRLQPAQGARVRVRLASGEVPERVHWQVRDVAGRTALAETRSPREDGIFELSTLSPGAWTLLVRADGSAVLIALELSVERTTVEAEHLCSARLVTSDER